MNLVKGVVRTMFLNKALSEGVAAILQVPGSSRRARFAYALSSCEARSGEHATGRGRQANDAPDGQ